MMTVKKRRRLEGMDIAAFTILTVVVILIAFPFYISVVTSITTNASYMVKPVQVIPRSFTMDNYDYVLKHLDILTGYRNTLFIVVVGTALSMAVSLCYAYALSWDDFPGKKLAFVFLIITMYFGGGLIPNYLLMKNLKLVNNTLAIVFMGAVSPYYIMIMRNGIMGLPDSVLDAARIDGATEGRLFTSIVLPLVKPVIVTFALFTAVNYWNEWYWSMILLTKSSTKSLQIMLKTVVTSLDATSRETMGAAEEVEAFTQGLKMAAVVITMLPIMVVYPFLQRFFAAGILVGAVKS